MPSLEALLEGERRGLLNEDHKALLTEARRRGMAPVAADAPMTSVGRVQFDPNVPPEIQRKILQDLQAGLPTATAAATSAPPIIRPEGFWETLGSEASAGLDEIAAANDKARGLTPAQQLASPVMGPIGDAIQGGLRVLGSPFTAAGRATGQTVQDLTLPYIGVTGSSGLAALTDAAVQLLSPNIVAKGLSVTKNLVLPKIGKAAQIEQLSKPIAVPRGPDILTAESELGKATQATAGAMKNLVQTQRLAPPPLPPDLVMAESGLTKATVGTRNAIKQSLAAQEQARQLANRAKLAIPTEQQARQGAAALSPVQKNIVEAGEFGIESFRKQRAIAEKPFKQFYSTIENAYPGKRFEPKNALAVKERISGMAEPLEQGIATRAERIAGQEIGVVGSAQKYAQMSDEEVAKIAQDILRAYKNIAEPHVVITPSAVQRAAGVKTVENSMSMKDMILARRRMGALARGAAEGGDMTMASEFQAMKNAYFQDIATVNPKLAERLLQVDKQYATEFIPKFGFESVASKAIEGAGVGEGLIPGIFKPFNRATKDDLATIRAAKAAFAPEDFNVIARSFIDDLIQKSAVDGEFNPVKFRNAINRYRPETLIEGMGQSGYQNLKQFAIEMDNAIRLGKSAKVAGKTAKEMKSLSKTAFDAEQEAQGRVIDLAKERENLLNARIAEAEKRAKEAFDIEGSTGKRYRDLEAARGRLEIKLNDERIATLKRLEETRLRNIARKGFEHAGRWSGPLLFIHSAVRGNPAGMAQGALLTAAGPMIADIILRDRTGKILRGIGGMVPGTTRASARAAQINALLNTKNVLTQEQ